MKEYHSGTNLFKYLLEFCSLYFCKTMEDQKYVTVTVKGARLNV